MDTPRRVEHQQTDKGYVPVYTTAVVEQPWADLGLKLDEYQRIRDILERRPTSSELAMYSVMWSEHCVEDLYGPSTDGLGFFTSVLKQVVNA